MGGKELRLELRIEDVHGMDVHFPLSLCRRAAEFSPVFRKGGEEYLHGAYPQRIQKGKRLLVVFPLKQRRRRYTRPHDVFRRLLTFFIVPRFSENVNCRKEKTARNHPQKSDPTKNAPPAARGRGAGERPVRYSLLRPSRNSREQLKKDARRSRLTVSGLFTSRHLDTVLLRSPHSRATR